MYLRKLVPDAMEIYGATCVALGDRTPIAYVDKTDSSIWRSIPIPSSVHRVAVHTQKYVTHGPDKIRGDVYEIVNV